MRRRSPFVLSFTVASIAALRVTGAVEAPPKIHELARGSIAALGRDPVVVDAVRRENAKGKTIEAIKSLDAKWMATPGVADFMQALVDNPCGKRLAKARVESPGLVEIFVTDRQGANVCMTNKTTDYWQGDEAKFTKAFVSPAGAVFVDSVKFDESVQTYVAQVSVPVVDAGVVIGVLVAGVDVEAVK